MDRPENTQTPGIVPSLPKPELIRFLAPAFALGYLTQLAAVRAGVPGPGRSWLLLTMWTPAAAALLAGPAAFAWALGFSKRLAWWCWPVGLAVGLLPVVLAALFSAAAGWGGWSSENFPLDPGSGGTLGVRAWP